MSVRIPLEPEIPFYSIGVQLDGDNFTLDIHWNDRHGVWYYDVLDVNGDVIAANLAILVNSFPLRKHRDTRLPKGFFIVRDLSGEATDATFEDLGVRVVLEFYDQDDWAEVKAGL